MRIMVALAAEVNDDAAVGWASHEPARRLSFKMVWTLIPASPVSAKLSPL